MDGLAPTLRLILDLRQGLERGQSTLTSLRASMSEQDVDLKSQIRELLLGFERQKELKAVTDGIASPYRRALFQLIWSSLNGDTILKKLNDLEREVQWACEEEVEKYINKLPVQVMIPILLLQFPAFLLLVIGPILSEILKELAL